MKSTILLILILETFNVSAQQGIKLKCEITEPEDCTSELLLSVFIYSTDSTYRFLDWYNTEIYAVRKKDGKKFTKQYLFDISNDYDKCIDDSSKVPEQNCIDTKTKQYVYNKLKQALTKQSKVKIRAFNSYKDEIYSRIDGSLIFVKPNCKNLIATITLPTNKDGSQIDNFDIYAIYNPKTSYLYYPNIPIPYYPNRIIPKNIGKYKSIRTTLKSNTVSVSISHIP